MSSLSDLLSNLFGISIEPANTDLGETWHESIRKLNVFNKNKRIGSIYCDLSERHGKFPGPVHFTIRCSRNTQFDLSDPEISPTLQSPFSTQDRDVIVVVSLPLKSVLSYDDIKTVYHEFGHAIHSLLGRTEFQHISGTRTSLDFVEVPSTLFELLAAQSYPDINNETRLKGVDEAGQLYLSRLDQVFHSELSSGFSVDNMAQTLVKEMGYESFHSSRPEAFNHIVTYGAGYYSYAWSRIIAERIHSNLFNTGDMRKNGELIREEMLSLGGGRDPWIILQRLGILNPQELETGILEC